MARSTEMRILPNYNLKQAVQKACKAYGVSGFLNRCKGISPHALVSVLCDISITITASNELNRVLIELDLLPKGEDDSPVNI
jgi:hypothetical protein